MQRNKVMAIKANKVNRILHRFTKYLHLSEALLSVFIGRDRAGPFFELIKPLILPKFSQMRSICEEVDKDITKYVKSLDPDKSAKEIRGEYSAVCNQQLNKHWKTLGNLLYCFELLYPLFAKKVDPSLEVQVDRELEEITYRSKMNELTVKKPSLFWDCNRGSLDDEKHDKTCPIHSQEDGDEIGRLFGEKIVAINYDGVEVLWVDQDDFWPPSIDAFHFTQSLRNDGLCDANIESVLDIGTGTGFLGLWLAKHNSNVKQLYMSDWLLTPLLFAGYNAWRNIKSFSGRDVAYRLLPGIYDYWSFDGESAPVTRFDVLLCNPPYLPLPNDKMGKYHSTPVTGTELLEFVIRESHRLAKTTYISFSDLANEDIEDCLSGDCKLEAIGEAYVPFRITDVMKDEEVLSFLKKRGLEEPGNKHHRYYHTVRTYKIVNS